MTETETGPFGRWALYFLAWSAVLVFANWAKPQEDSGFWHALFAAKWRITGAFAILLALGLWRFLRVKPLHIVLAAVPAAAIGFAFPQQPVAAFAAGAVGLAVLTFFGGAELEEWRDQTWGFAKQILPLASDRSSRGGLLPREPFEHRRGVRSQQMDPDAGGRFAGRPSGGDGKSRRVSVRMASAIWPLWTNLFASVVGALMYFATLTEVPILRGLLDSGMGQGPALALLLAGPALSLPNMLVINSILGPKKTITFVTLVVIMATVTGMIFGAITGGV